MQSEFQNVGLDQIRYSLVWEDSATLYAGLQIQPRDKVLVITSAGCNVLNVLLKNPAQVTAIDLNPVQNLLLAFKKHLILNFDQEVLRGLMGLEGPETVGKTWQKVATGLPTELQNFGTSLFQKFPQGLLMAGRLESYLTRFYHTLPDQQQKHLQELITFGDVKTQLEFFQSTLHKSDFRKRFITYFDAANLSQGRDPRLFKYAQETGGEAFYNRLVKQISETPVKHNFFFRFFFFGPENLPEAILPPCYQQKNFLLLRSQLPKLQQVTGEAIEYLLSPAGKAISKASLSNIFEYTSETEFHSVCQRIFKQETQNPEIIFWNLLQDQGKPAAKDCWETREIPVNSARSQACFYFRNVRVLAPALIPVF